MIRIPPVTVKRLSAAVPKFRKILKEAKERDVNESDTSTIVIAILEEVFGFDKYSEITKEHPIPGGKYCDIAIKTDKKIEYLIEVKAIGSDLTERHLNQVIGYAVHEGIDWVVLTNGIIWEVHYVKVQEHAGVKSTKLVSFDFTTINPRKKEDQEVLFNLCKRGVAKNVIDEFHERLQIVNRYTIGVVMLSEPVINVIRKELRNIKNGLKVSNEEIEELISEEVLKRDLIESEVAQQAKKKIQKILNKKTKKPRPEKKIATSDDHEAEASNGD